AAEPDPEPNALRGGCHSLERGSAALCSGRHPMTDAPRSCPVCGTGSDKATLFMEEHIDSGRLSAFSYASRKEPEFMCHRLILCPTCDLVYVAEPPGSDELARAYHVASFDSSEEADDAAAAYIRAIRPTLDRLKRKEAALEIGAGTGIF